MSIHKLTLTTLALLCAVAGLLALSPVSARASITHKYLSRIAEVPAEGPHGEAVPSHGPLSEVRAMTVEEGHLWVAERGGEGTGVNQVSVERVDEFDAANGGFEEQFPLPAGLEYFSEHVAVRRATPELSETELYLAGTLEYSKHVVEAFTPSGSLQQIWEGKDTPDGSFTSRLDDVSVDNSKSIVDWAAGDVYVATSSQSEPKDNVVDVFKPEVGGGEQYVGQLPGPEPGGYFSNGADRRLAVDEANGDVLVAEGEGTRERVVYVFEPTAIVGQYALAQTLTGPEGRPFSGNGDLQVAVDGGAGAGSGDVYVADQSGNVYEFGPEGEYLGKLAGTPAGGFGVVTSLAVDSSSGDVYVGAFNGEAEVGVVDVFGSNVAVPDVTTAPASVVAPTSAVLNGTVDPDGAGPATCEFVWGTGELFGEASQPCEAGVPEGSAPVAVVGLLEKLQPDTTYYYRLRATNTEDGLTNPGEAFQDQHFTTPGPGIEDESASNVASTSATLDTTIDPHGAPTSFYFQYGTSSEYGGVVPASPGVALGSGEEGLEAGRHVQGLQSGTVYHYRVVAFSEVTYEVEPGKLETKVEAFDGRDETFTTQVAGAFALPDGRRWEMVSSPDKLGANILSLNNEQGGQTQASANGNAIAYVTNTPTESGAPGYPGLVTVLSTRGPEGWSSRDLVDPHRLETGAPLDRGAEYRLFSPDLSEAVVQPFGVFEPSLSPEASEQTAFLHTDFLGGNVDDPCVNGCFRPLVTGVKGVANVPPGSVFGQINLEPFGFENDHCPPAPYCGPRLEDATPDLGHIVLKTGSGTPEFPYGLYEWTAGKLAFVGESQGSFLGGGFDGAILSHAISDDGSRVIFTGAGGQLYMRDLSTGTTVQLDASGAPIFEAASGDGSKVFFSANAALTGDAGGGNNLYECEMVEEAGGLTCKLTDLTPRNPGGEDGHALGVVGASEDGSYVYFVADGVLENKGVPVRGAVRGSCEPYGNPADEACDLYVRHDGLTELVAVLSGDDAPDWGGQSTINGPSTGSVSSDGRWLAFMSSGNLTGYDTRDALTDAPDQEVYLYDAETGRLVCASCNPSGARPVGAGGEESPLVVGGASFKSGLAADIPGLEAFNGSYIAKRAYRSRYLSDSGRLFFNSHDALVPQDVNGAWDVYEYEPPSVGGCTGASAAFSARSDGCVGLISSGGSPLESAFLDASEEGGDVFFLTAARLAPQDYDNSYDVYDAHECTADSPCPPAGAVAPPPCGSGDSCKPAPSPQPSSFGAPASATFSGAGNVSPAAPAAKSKSKSKRPVKCRRGFVKRGERCVKRPKARRAGRGGVAGRSATGRRTERGRR